MRKAILITGGYDDFPVAEQFKLEIENEERKKEILKLALEGKDISFYSEHCEETIVLMKDGGDYTYELIDVEPEINKQLIWFLSNLLSEETLSISNFFYLN